MTDVSGEGKGGGKSSGKGGEAENCCRATENYLTSKCYRPRLFEVSSAVLKNCDSVLAPLRFDRFIDSLFVNDFMKSYVG